MELVVKNFKQTDFGLIPNDWKVKPIVELISMMTNGFVGIIKSHYTDYENGILYIQGYNVEENSFNFHGIKRITEEFHKSHSRSCLQAGDLLTIQTGDIGITTVVPKELEGANCHALIITRFTKGIADSRFYSYYFNFSGGRKRLKEIETGSTMKHINVGDMIQMLMPYPAKSEQTLIANALSDVDALISSLEKFIVKKRNIKQGAMQKLLQPKKGWKLMTLGDIAVVRDGTHQTPKYVESGVPFYSVESVTNNNFKKPKFISEEEHNFLTRTFRIEKGDILMTRIGSIGDCKLIDWDVKASFYVSLALLKMKEGFSANFLCHYSKSSYFKKEVELKSLQYAIPRKINLGPISTVNIEIPNIKEQLTIANILSDMDIEISALETKLAKYRNIKLGMMQYLLTGKIRLI